jgi:hypothetical protein
MNLLIGASWLVFWLLVKVFSVELMNAVLATAIIFILVGLLLDASPRLQVVKRS